MSGHTKALGMCLRMRVAKKMRLKKKGTQLGMTLNDSLRSLNSGPRQGEAKVFITRRMAFPDLCFGKMTGKVTES